MRLSAQLGHFTLPPKKAVSRFAALLALLLLLPLGLQARSVIEARYPFDPVCPWGRLSNGKGMIHRCISQSEAEGLYQSEADKKGKARGKASQPAKEESLPQALPQSYTLSVGPIKAENGDISVGRLHLPVERYRSCVDEKGGLKSNHAKVVVKFLVRGEKLRAEGVSVETFKGVSRATADCIAEVVDRRKVGAPSVPITAARLSFEMQVKK